MSPSPQALGRDELGERPVLLSTLAVICGAAITAGLAFRVAGAVMQSAWGDEAVTIDLLRLPFGTMLHALPYSERTPPLYYIVAWGWARIFGFGVLSLRSLSLLFGAGAVPLVYFAVRELGSRRAALLATALAAASPGLVWYSQEIRAYALVIFLTAASLLFFARALAQPTQLSALVGWGVTAALGVATHYYAASFIAIELCILAWVSRPRRLLLLPVGLIAAGVAAGVAIAPRSLHSNDINTAGGVTSRISIALQQLLLGLTAPTRHVHLAELLVLATALLVLSIALANGEERRNVIFVSAIGVGGASAGVLASVAGGLGFSGRHIVAAWIPLAAAYSLGLSGRRLANLGAVIGVASVGVSLLLCAAVFARPTLQRDDWRGVARIMRTAPAHTVVVTTPLRRDVYALQLYAPRLRFTFGSSARSNSAAVVTRDVQAAGFRGLPGFYVVAERHVSNMTVWFLRSRRPAIVESGAVVEQDRVPVMGVLPRKNNGLPRQNPLRSILHLEK